MFLVVWSLLQILLVKYLETLLLKGSAPTPNFTLGWCRGYIILRRRLRLIFYLVAGFDARVVQERISAYGSFRHLFQRSCWLLLRLIKFEFSDWTYANRLIDVWQVIVLLGDALSILGYLRPRTSSVSEWSTAGGSLHNMLSTLQALIALPLSSRWVYHSNIV